MMFKKALRQIYKIKRANLSSKYIQSTSIVINDFLLDYILKNGLNNIHVYLSHEGLKEIQTNHLIQKLWENKIHVITSVSNFKDSSMSNYEIKPDTPIQLSKYKIPEPVATDLFDEKQIEMVVTPMLCFDEKGYRVGYGKGFYDRFFAKCRADVLKFGVCWYPPIAKIEDTDEYDYALNQVITPDHHYVF